MVPYASTLAFFSDVMEAEFSPFSVDFNSFQNLPY
jgi:hypothetical protein